MDKLNARGNRQVLNDELELYDVRKARPAIEYLSKNVDNFNICSNEETFEEDSVIEMHGTRYLLELQVVGYWHNFEYDFNKFTNLYVSKSKIDIMRNKIQPGESGKFIWFNCVPNQYMTLDIEQFKDEWIFTRPSGSLSYMIPIEKNWDIIRYFTFEYLLNNEIEDYKCDCSDKHMNIINRNGGRAAQLYEDYNERGNNFFCCGSNN